jgi:hypothetical protein
MAPLLSGARAVSAGQDARNVTTPESAAILPIKDAHSVPDRPISHPPATGSEGPTELPRASVDRDDGSDRSVDSVPSDDGASASRRSERRPMTGRDDTLANASTARHGADFGTTTSVGMESGRSVGYQPEAGGESSQLTRGERRGVVGDVRMASASQRRQERVSEPEPDLPRREGPPNASEQLSPSFVEYGHGSH